LCVPINYLTPAIVLMSILFMFKWGAEHFGPGPHADQTHGWIPRIVYGGTFAAMLLSVASFAWIIRHGGLWAKRLVMGPGIVNIIILARFVWIWVERATR
jgi:hypothetical protein